MEVSQELCSGRSNGVSRPQDRGSSGNSCFQDYSNRSTRRLPHFSLLFEKEAKVSGPRTLTFEPANGRNPFGRLMQIQWWFTWYARPHLCRCNLRITANTMYRNNAMRKGSAPTDCHRVSRFYTAIIENRFASFHIGSSSSFRWKSLRMNNYIDDRVLWFFLYLIVLFRSFVSNDSIHKLLF